MKFFHQAANSNRRNNSIESLLVNSSVSSYQTKIREHIVQFYDRLFTQQFGWPPKLDDLVFYSIDEEETPWLERPFDKSEVVEVMKSMNSDKAPAFDGYTMAFFQVC
jgi:hypothetical protein